MMTSPGSLSITKEWHLSVDQTLRNHLVCKIVKSIFPDADPAALHDGRVRDLVTYARNVEKEMFEKANDREEYYRLLAVKVYQTQKEIHEKRHQQQHLTMAQSQFQ